MGPPGSAGRRDWPGAFPGPQGPPGSVGRGPPPSESAAAGTSPDDSQGSAARLAYPPGTYWRFPSRNEEFHPRQYWHRYQLESATRKLTNEWSEWKQTRDIFQSRQRIVAKKMRLWVGAIESRQSVPPYAAVLQAVSHDLPIRASVHALREPI